MKFLVFKSIFDIIFLDNSAEHQQDEHQIFPLFSLISREKLSVSIRYRYSVLCQQTIAFAVAPADDSEQRKV